MKNSFKFYIVIWAVLLAAWCAIVFLVRPVIPEYVVNYDARFWVAFAFILVAFFGNLACACYALRADNLQKLFYHMPLITISWSALIAMLVVGSATMLIPGCPAWVAAVACIVILAFNAITLVKATAAANIVGQIDDKVKAKTSFIKNLTVDAESIMARAKSDEVKAECKKVYEAVRYSDPMSNEALSVIETKITVKVDEFSSAVSADDEEKAKEIADEIVFLVNDRNKKCKVIK